MKTVVQCYNDWIKMKVTDIPSFMIEPMESEHDIDPMRRLRNYSYIGAISTEFPIRAGLQLLSYVGHTSPEILEQFGHPVNSCVGPPSFLPSELLTDSISAILNQRNSENEYLLRHADEANVVCPQERCPSPIESETVFHQCRKLFDQLGLPSFETRKSIHTLRKNYSGKLSS